MDRGKVCLSNKQVQTSARKGRRLSACNWGTGLIGEGSWKITCFWHFLAEIWIEIRWNIVSKCSTIGALPSYHWFKRGPLDKEMRWKMVKGGGQQNTCAPRRIQLRGGLAALWIYSYNFYTKKLFFSLRLLCVAFNFPLQCFKLVSLSLSLCLFAGWIADEVHGLPANTTTTTTKLLTLKRFSFVVFMVELYFFFLFHTAPFRFVWRNYYYSG